MHKIGHQKRNWTIAHEQRHYAAGVELEAVPVPIVGRIASRLARIQGVTKKTFVITIKGAPAYYVEDRPELLEEKRLVFTVHSSKVFSDYNTAQAAIDNGAFRPDILGCDCEFCVTWRENNA